MFFCLKNVIPESSELRELAEGSVKEEDLLVELLKRKQTSELPAILEEVKRYKSKVGTISDHLILRNSQTIIEQAVVVKELLSKTETSEVRFEAVTSRVQGLNDGFVAQYDQMEQNLATLEKTYQTRKFAAKYLKFLEARNQLVDIVSKPFDVEKASVAYKKCIEHLHMDLFQGLKHFEEAREQVESSKTLIAAECTSKLMKALDDLSFTESRMFIFAFDNLHLMQIKIQEIANKTMRDNFGLIKDMFTDDLELDSKDLKGSLENFVPRINQVFGQILKQSQRVWILEVSFYERKSSIKEKDLVSLFMLYFGKLLNMIVQTFQKLVENKTKLPVNYEMIYLSGPMFLKALSDLTEKVFLFIIAHPTGHHQNYITLESLNEVAHKDLPALIQREFVNIFTEKFEELHDTTVAILEEVQSASMYGLRQQSLEDLENYLRLIVYLLQNYQASSKLILTQVSVWLREVFDYGVSLISPEEVADDGTRAHERQISREVVSFLRYYKMVVLLTRISYHLSLLVLAIPDLEVEQSMTDAMNNHSAILASIAKRLVQAASHQKVLTQLNVLQDVCVSLHFLSTLTSLIDSRPWSDPELDVLRFLATCRILISQRVDAFTQGRTQIDDSVKAAFSKALEGYELESDEVYLVNQLRPLTS